jgi:hypothetical protein
MTETRVASGSGAKNAFLNLLEEEKAWLDSYKKASPFLLLKRYKIVNVDPFSSRGEAEQYIKSNLPFKMRANSAGCVIINSNEELKYLFFTQQ